jgi:phosphoribosylglycinamide formyltransferase-1
MTKKKIAVFASGSGTNAQRIFEHFKDHSEIEVSLLFSNKPNAKVLERGKNFNIPSIVFNRDEFYHSEKILNTLLENKIDFIVLAGFLWLIPKNLINAFPNKIVNIHPALLPKYGGKGMYGENVHKAVKLAGESESGITIHLVNNNYDEGDIVVQYHCKLQPNDDEQEIAAKVLKLEHKFYPEVIENLVLK